MKNKKVVVFLEIILLITISCSNHTEVLSIESITNSFQHAGKWQKEEYFIIVNPPKNIVELAKYIADYNAATMIEDDILTYSGWYSRTFYKKTAFTMEMYNADNSDYAFKLAQEYLDTLFATKWSYNEENGIYVRYIQLGHYRYDDENVFRYEINNAKGVEIFYPWLKDGSQCR
jgi:hypothetical protein